MKQTIATCALGLSMLLGAATHAGAQATTAPAAKAPTSIDTCMLLLVTAGNKIQAAKLDAAALKDMKTKGQQMAVQCQTSKFADAFATHQAILKALSAAK